MSIIEEEVGGSHTEDDQEHDAQLAEVFKAFDIEPKEEKQEKSVNDKPPAKEEVKQEIKTHKFKHNKEDVEIDISTDEKLTDHLQRSLALDKERERKNELEKTLDRAAKLAGYRDHSEYAAKLDQLEEQQKQSKQNDLDLMRKDLLDQLEANGIDREKAEQFIENHPLIKQSKEAIQRDEARNSQDQQSKQEQESLAKWDSMYKDPRVLAAFPDILKDSEAFTKNEMPTFFTPEMKARIEKGYDPLDAMLLSHADKFQGQSKKATEQRLIKEQQLGLRSRVETNPSPDTEPQVPAELASAFAAFGLPAESAKKYVKAR